MKATVTVPNLSEITLEQYQRFLKVQQINKDDEYIIKLKMIEIFCNVDFKDARNIKFTDVERIIEKLTESFHQKPNLIKTFKMDGVEYGFIPSMEEMTFGEYIDVDTYLPQDDQMHLAMNVLYRPITSKKAGKYSIEDYDINTKERMKQMPLKRYVVSHFFFAKFRLGVTERYEQLFTGGNGETTTLSAGFGKKWGWYSSIYALAQGDIERFEGITSLELDQCLTMLTFMKEKNEVEAQQIKNKQRR